MIKNINLEYDKFCESLGAPYLLGIDSFPKIKGFVELVKMELDGKIKTATSITKN